MAGTTGNEPLFQLRDIRHRFGPIEVLHGIDVDLCAGEVLALVGQNGSGKSTLMKIAYGDLQPTAGTVRVGGRDVRFASPRHAQDAGVAAVPQEVPVAPDLTVAENVFLGRPITRQGRIDLAGMRRIAREILADLASSLDPSRLVRDLDPADRQVVAVARAVRQQARILILDEPTSSLTNERADALFGLIDALRAKGMAIVYITQRLDDLARIADRVVVLRDGLVVADTTLDHMDLGRLVEVMVGEPVEEFFRHSNHDPGREVLQLAGITLGSGAPPFDLSVRAGEIVGLAGIVGAGCSTLLRALYGLEPAPWIACTVNGSPALLDSPRSALAAGLAMVTADRKTEGLVLARPASDNVFLSEFAGLGLTAGPTSSLRKRAQTALERFHVHPSRSELPAGSFSGGNQQKIVFAKCMATDPSVLLLDEPTRGVDVGAKAEIYRIIDDFVRSGGTVLVYSSEFAELLGISDRIAVLFDGGLIAEGPADAFSASSLTSLTGGSPP